MAINITIPVAGFRSAALWHGERIGRGQNDRSVDEVADNGPPLMVKPFNVKFAKSYRHIQTL